MAWLASRVPWRLQVGHPYLIAAWTGPEALVCEVELLDAEWAGLFFIVVDELILQTSRHHHRGRHGGHEEGGETREEAAGEGIESAPSRSGAGGDGSRVAILL